MSGAEEIVVAYLDARESDPSLTPETFLERRGDTSPETLRAIRHALDLEGLLRAETGPDGLLPAALSDARLVGPLGEGGMGRVLEVERDGGRFALKLMHAASLADARALRRFRREAAILGDLEHPGIVRCVAHGADDRPPWLLLEKVVGAPLSEIETPLDPNRAAAIVRALADATHAAHQAGLLHRDIKPSNVILRDDGSPVLLDFGMAAARDASTLTQTGDRLGTPSYMAPEQVRGDACDARTDVHALGLILFELLTGRAARESGSREEVLAAARRGGVPRPSSVAARTPSALDRVALCACARTPGHRYATAAALAEDLGRFLDGRPVEARPPGPLRRTAALVRERPVPALVVTVLILLALASGFFLGSESAPGDDEVDRLFDRAVAAWSAGHDVRARRLHGELEELAPDDARTVQVGRLLGREVGASDADDVARLLLEARLALDRRKRSEAFRLARRAAEALPDSVSAAGLVGASATTPDELAWARGWLSDLALRHSDSAGAAAAHAKVLRRLGDLDEAEAELRRGLESAPGFAPLHHDLAVLLHKRERTEEAAASAREAARLTKGESRAVLNNLAAFLDVIGEVEEAEIIYRDLVKRYPAHFRGWFNLAYLLDRQFRLGEARDAYEKCLDRKPDCLEATLCLAWLLATSREEEHRDVDRAFELLREARVRHGEGAPNLARLIRDVERRTGRRLEP